jgi:hypothetical protein
MGPVLIPNEVDTQRDFLRPDAIRRLYEPDPDDGILHAAFPEDASELVRYEVVDEPVRLGGEEFPAGALIATRKYHDPELWGFVRDGILGGFFIGGEVTEEWQYDTGEVLPDVYFPHGVELRPATELTTDVGGEVTLRDPPKQVLVFFQHLARGSRLIVHLREVADVDVEVERDVRAVRIGELFLDDIDILGQCVEVVDYLLVMLRLYLFGVNRIHIKLVHVPQQPLHRFLPSKVFR